MITPEQRKKYREAADLINQWLDEGTDYDERVTQALDRIQSDPCKFTTGQIAKDAKPEDFNTAGLVCTEVNHELGVVTFGRINDSEVAPQAKRQAGVTSGERPAHLSDEEAARARYPGHDADQSRYIYLAGCARIRSGELAETQRQLNETRTLVEEMLPELYELAQDTNKAHEERVYALIFRAELLLSGAKDGDELWPTPEHITPEDIAFMRKQKRKKEE